MIGGTAFWRMSYASRCVRPTLQSSDLSEMVGKGSWSSGSVEAIDQAHFSFGSHDVRCSIS